MNLPKKLCATILQQRTQYKLIHLCCRNVHPSRTSQTENVWHRYNSSPGNRRHGTLNQRPRDASALGKRKVLLDLYEKASRHHK